ncbi:MAG: RCC1 domain-containing protein [Bacillota bacterium]
MILKEDGTVWAWGENEYGQLGNGPGKSAKEPVQIKGLTNATAIAAGRYYGLALNKDGDLWTWGLTLTHFGEIRQAFEDRYGPIKSISAGPFHRLYVENSSTIVAGGANGAGQVGSDMPVPFEMFFTLYEHSFYEGRRYKLKEPVTAVAAGAYHSLALTDGGNVLSWGENRRGQLGNGSKSSRLKPGAVDRLRGVKAIAAGGLHSLALKDDGTVWAWGDNSCGQLGDGSFTGRDAPVQVRDLSGVISIAAGYTFSVALKDDGTVWAWGDNTCGQLDRKEIANSNRPVRLENLSKIVSIAAGTSHGLALANDYDTVWYWGYVGYDRE